MKSGNHWNSPITGMFPYMFPYRILQLCLLHPTGKKEAYLQLITHEADAMPLAFGNEERRNAPRH